MKSCISMIFFHYVLWNVACKFQEKDHCQYTYGKLCSRELLLLWSCLWKLECLNKKLELDSVWFTHSPDFNKTGATWLNQSDNWRTGKHDELIHNNLKRKKKSQRTLGVKLRMTKFYCGQDHHFIYIKTNFSPQNIHIDVYIVSLKFDCKINNKY